MNTYLEPYEITMHSGGVRKGAILILEENGKYGYGDIAPLPGWSLESLEEAIEELNHPESDSLPPSLAFAYHSALCDLKGIKIKKTKYCYLFTAWDKDLFKKLRSLPATATVKIKVENPAESIFLIKQVQEVFPGKLRIDVNRKWSLEEALTFGLAFKEGSFEYIEDPVRNFKDLKKFHKKTHHPFALDDLFRESTIKEILHLNGLAAIVYKPTLSGPIIPKLPVPVVLSSSFESPVGIKGILQLITLHNLFDTAHGIDTLKFFSEQKFSSPSFFSTHSLTQKPFKMKNGIISPCSALFSK